MMLTDVCKRVLVIDHKPIIDMWNIIKLGRRKKVLLMSSAITITFFRRRSPLTKEKKSYLRPIL